jgi:CHAT domain-containing protein/tetratricopeptide (TPR) repeat protein
MLSRTVRAVLLVCLSVVVCGPPLDGQTPPGDPEQILRAGRELTTKNEYGKSIQLLDTIPETADPRIVVRKHTSMAVALANLSRYADAHAHVARARQLAAPLNDPAISASIESAEGGVYRLGDRYDLAIAAFERGAALAQQAGDRTVLGRIYGQLSSAYASLEDWERAAYWREKGFAQLANPTYTDRFNNLMDRGIGLFELYDRDGAEAAYKEALALALQHGGKRDESFARGEIGYVYWAFDRDYPRALEWYDQAVALAREASTTSMLGTWLLNRGGIYRDSGRYEQALTDYRGFLALAKTDDGLSRQVFAATKNVGQTYRLMGRNEQSLTILEPLVRDRPGNPSPRHLWQAHMELASTYDALGRRVDAEAQYNAMLDVLEEHRNSSILDAFRSGSFAHNLSRYDPYDRYVRFLAADPAGARAAEALHVAERARARGFLEEVASMRSMLASAVPGALVQEQKRIVRAISDTQRQLRNPDLPRPQREDLLVKLAQDERERDDFRVKLRVEHPSLAEARYPEVAAPAAIQPLLRDNETAIVFYLSEPESFRWTVTRGGVTLDRIAARKDVEAAAARMRALLRAPGDTGVARAEAAALSTALLDRVQLPAGGPVIVVPHGVLHYIPFEVLPDGGSPLIERHAVSYAPSLNSFAQLRRRPYAPQPFRVLAVGNPSIAKPDAVNAATRNGDIDSVALLGPLPFAEEELGAIRGKFRWSTELLSGRDARESAFRAEDLARYPVIHFATHGLFNERHPSRSALLFSPEAGEDGLLQMPEIYRLGLRADLVVLSACQTALGREITGEGIVGLTRAFFYAGSRSVVAALWNLNDRFAADFVERFYDGIRAGHTAEEALRLTKAAYLNHPQYSHPFYWSSLILTGDGTHVLYRPSRAWMAWTAAAAVALAVTALLRRRRAET